MPGSCIPARLAIPRYPGKEPVIPASVRTALLQPFARPTRPFLTALAAAGMLGALLLTPAGHLETPPLSTIAEGTSAAAASAQPLAAPLLDSSSLGERGGGPI